MRRAILARLLQGPLPVGELASGLPVSRPAISAGNRRLYRLNPAGFETLREYLDQFWSQALSAFAREVEKRAKKELQ